MSKDFYDVCVICALHEEAQAFFDVLEAHDLQPKEEYNSQLQRSFYSATMQNNVGEPLKLFITWAPDMGGIDISTELERILNLFSIRFAAMTGICAGNKDRVKLGDLIVAESAHLYDSGSYITTTSGESEHRPNIKTIQVLPTILHSVRSFDGWQDEGLKLDRPASKHQQTDWLLSTLLEKKSLKAIDQTILAKYAPKWRVIIQELKQGTEPILDAKLQINEALVQELMYGPEEFPYHDPLTPTCYIGPMASGNSVRKDNPFPAISQSVDKILGLDMECWAFYHTLRERYNIHALFAKGVCDYGDGHKDDTYHEYAARLSATYMHAFIKKFVTQQRMPWPEDQGPTPPARQLPSTTPATMSSTDTTDSKQVTDKKPVKVFFSYSQSQTDKRLISDLNNHLALLRRSQSIDSWYRHDTYAGDTTEKVVEEKLKEAQLIILLLTPDYIGSDFYEQEYNLIRACHEKGARVIPVLLRMVPIAWKGEFYGKLQAIPRIGGPINSWNNKDEAMANVVEEISNVVLQLSGESQKFDY